MSRINTMRRRPSMKPRSTPPIRLAVLGLDSGFFPENFALWTQLCQNYPWINPPFPRAVVTAAATLGRSEREIVNNAGITPQQFARKYNLKLYVDADELLDQEKPDGVFVCGRPSCLPAIAMQAVRRGIHVYVQKPTGAAADQVAAVAREAKKRGVAAAAGITLRHDDAVMASKEQLRAADMGRLCSLRVMSNHGMPGGNTWYFDKGEGGPELWLGWYAIDLLHCFTGARITRLFATGHRGDGSGRRENTIIHAACEFANGVKGSLDFYGNIYYPYSRAEWELLGERGLIRNVQRHEVEVYQRNRPQQALYRNQFWDGVARDINAWLHSWTTGKTTGLTLAGAAEVVRVAAAIRKSFTTGKAVAL
ncbi:MAG: Gfo/Idh/MocA family oxidoreductase [Verrucomicrobia bacterium]|nr:Gfo/Idh/MocA family oxidoreductase [Verrucomicrobiota bacterium]